MLCRSPCSELYCEGIAERPDGGPTGRSSVGAADSRLAGAEGLACCGAIGSLTRGWEKKRAILDDWGSCVRRSLDARVVDSEVAMVGQIESGKFATTTPSMQVSSGSNRVPFNVCSQLNGVVAAVSEETKVLSGWPSSTIPPRALSVVDRLQEPHSRT